MDYYSEVNYQNLADIFYSSQLQNFTWASSTILITLTKPYIGMFLQFWATLKELEESDVTLKEPYIAMFQSSEVTLTCLHVKQF